MANQKIASGIYYVGVSHYDRRLFDALISTPEGTTYNSYIVQGQKATALIDTVEPEFRTLLLQNIKSAGIKKIDYIISNHAEQDHSGSIPDLLAFYPEAKLVTNEKCRELLLAFMPQIPVDRIITVKDHETLDLGGRTLEFILAPWIHWPETMMTFLREDAILFPCDLFGSHLAVSNICMDDERVFYEPMKRYYAQIMMPYRSQAAKRVETVKTLAPKMICPSHGPIFKDTSVPLRLYENWVSDALKNEVLIPWVSTHGATARMAEHLTSALIERGIDVHPYDLTAADLGRIAGHLVDAATIAIGVSCVLTAAHPVAAYAALVANALRAKAKFATVFGSFGWNGNKVPDQIAALLGNLKVEILPSVMVKGAPTAKGFADLDKMADDILARHQSLGLK